MRPILLFVLFLSTIRAQGTLADYQRFLHYADSLRPVTAGIVGDMGWIGKTNRFWYARSTAAGTEYLTADTAGAKKPAFDHARLAQALAQLKHSPFNPDRLSLTNLQFNDHSVEFTLANDRFQLNLNTYELKLIPPASIIWSAGPRVAELNRPVPSPDGKSELFLRNYNLWIRDKDAPQTAAPLSTDGSEGNYYALSSQAWSPDGQKIAAYRVRPGQRRKIYYVESSPSDQVQPRPKELPYAKPGDALDVPQPVLFHAATRKQFVVDNALFPNPYSLSRFEWRKDSRALTFEYNQRGHQAFRVIEVDAATGTPRALVNEESQTFFCYYSKKFREDVNDGKEVVWMSERDGWNHLYLFDGATGRLKNQITKGEWVVRSVAAVDPAKRQIYFLASGMDSGRDPYFRHLFRIDFDGANLTRLTTADADHNAIVSPDFQYFVDSYSRPDLPSVTELRRTASNERIAELEAASDKALKQAGWRPPEVLHAKGRDGRTDIWGLLYRPSNFNPSAKYPVLEFIYAGPHNSFVPKRFTPASQLQAMAELGFIVVQIDGMGTSNRSKAFHDIAWKNLADAGFPDRILWHRAAAAKYPWYDLSRLGIYGHSAGGQNALGALLFHGDFYKAAVSSAGCHDNRMDKISWNEQWMGWPVGPEYAASSNVEYAHQLKGKLLLAVGELDTNVDPASTFQVANALWKAKKQFDLLVVPGADHGGWGQEWERKRADFFVRHLLNVAPPDWNAALPPLDKYVAQPDPVYGWKLIRQVKSPTHTTSVLELTSQSWRTAAEVDRPVWKHWLTITRPNRVSAATALLFIGAGANTDPPPDKSNERSARIAVETGSIVADLGMVPNQPLRFSDSPGKARSEDDLIAYSRVRHFATGDDTWLVRLAMVKSGVRAMDAIQDYLKTEKVDVKNFVVAGASKRGWTTWLIGAVDPRVKAIIPIVIDALNSQEITRHHFEVLGYFSPALQDYVNHGLFPHKIDTPEYRAVLAIEDPFNYRDRPALRMPKLLINASGDQFFLPDNSRYYYSQLPGEKHLRYVPNARHNLGGSDATESILAFYQSILANTKRPDFTWRNDANGTLTVTPKVKPLEVKLWQATNPTERDFRLDTLGPAYTATPLRPNANGDYTATVNRPATGYTAYFVELTFPGNFKFTTEIGIVPDAAPHSWSEAAARYATTK